MGGASALGLLVLAGGEDHGGLGKLRLLVTVFNYFHGQVTLVRGKLALEEQPLGAEELGPDLVLAHFIVKEVFLPIELHRVLGLELVRPHVHVCRSVHGGRTDHGLPQAFPTAT